MRRTSVLSYVHRSGRIRGLSVISRLEQIFEGIFWGRHIHDVMVGDSGGLGRAGGGAGPAYYEADTPQSVSTLGQGVSGLHHPWCNCLPGLPVQGLRPATSFEMYRSQLQKKVKSHAIRTAILTRRALRWHTRPASEALRSENRLLFLGLEHLSQSASSQRRFRIQRTVSLCSPLPGMSLRKRKIQHGETPQLADRGRLSGLC
jgi:hypothetical protein